MMQTAKAKKSNLGLFIIVGILFVLFLIFAVAVGALIVARQLNRGTAGANPLFGTNTLNQIDVAAIDPALALASLGGVPETDVISEALDNARPETALAALLFNPNLSNRETSGGFLQLAAVYTAAGQPQKATLAYELAGTVATLAPDISDTVRADLFIQAGEGLISLSQTELARLYLDQAFTIANRSPYLQAAHRRRIFERLQQNYLALNERNLARESLSLSANPPNLSLVVATEALLPAANPVPLPAAAQEAEAERWRAAQELAILLVERGGDAPPEAVEQLAQALINEDQQKLPFFDRELNNSTQLSQNTDILWAKINWLSLKYRVARQGYGISIVPDWEAQAEVIRADLTKTYEALFALYADFVIGLPNISQIDKATEERLRVEILAGELGRYPNYPEEQRRAQLQQATDQLISTQPERNIFVGVGEAANKRVYTLISLN